MDINNYLIIKKDKKTGIWIDNTEAVDNYKETPKGLYVKYIGKNDLYGPSKNYKVFTNPKVLGLVSCNGNFLDGTVLAFGEYIKVINNSTSRMLLRKEIEEVNTVSQSSYESVQETFSYFKNIAKERDKTSTIKNSIFNKLKYLKINSDSVLGTYISKSIIKDNEIKDDVIFPFRTNSSQKEAVINALKNSISVIEGPPGTGKTETILNLIANIIFRDKTVAVVSNNNSATKNVYDKLAKEGLAFITAELGSSDNQKIFFKKSEKIKDILNYIGINYNVSASDREDLRIISGQLTEQLKINNEIATLRDNLSRLKIEQKHFKETFKSLTQDIPNISIFNNSDSKGIRDLFLDLEHRLTPLHAIKLLLKYSVYNFKYIYKNPINSVSYVKERYYRSAIDEMSNRISYLESKCSNRENLILSYTECSNKLLRLKLFDKYSRLEDVEFDQETFRKDNFQDFTKRYPVIFSTTYSIQNSISKSYMFDYLIIDEASQVDLLTGILAMSCCKNIVVVGDRKQLSPIIENKNLYETFLNNYIDRNFDYTKESILSSLIGIYKELLPRKLLKEHYRCHPRIIGFCNQAFYNNELIIMTEEPKGDIPFEIIRKRSYPIRDSGSYYSQNQIDQATYILKSFDNTEKLTVGVISPYRANCNKIKQAITKEQLDTNKFDVDTIHKFQGKEKDVIVFSTVVDKIKDFSLLKDGEENFVDNEILINVAVSRAKKKFILLVSDNIYKSHSSNLGKLIRYIEYNFGNKVTSQGYISSIFELLYKDNKDKLIEFRSKSKTVSKYDSENIFNDLLTRVLTDSKYNCFSFIRNYRLYNFINDFSNLSLDEKKFVLYDSHIDFFIYNKIDKEAVLAIEVNGVSFHKNNSRQERRDTLKSQILDKIGIELISFFTDGSEEELKLREALDRKLSNSTNESETYKNVREQNEQGQGEQKHL